MEGREQPRYEPEPTQGLGVHFFTSRGLRTSGFPPCFRVPPSWVSFTSQSSVLSLPFPGGSQSFAPLFRKSRTRAGLSSGLTKNANFLTHGCCATAFGSSPFAFSSSFFTPFSSRSSSADASCPFFNLQRLRRFLHSLRKYLPARVSALERRCGLIWPEACPAAIYPRSTFAFLSYRPFLWGF